MKKALKNAAGSFIISLAFTCMISLVFFNALRTVLSKENITKSIQHINVNDILQTNLEQYEGYVKDYKGSTNIFDETKLRSTSFSREELEQVINSKEYADILGSYIVDEDIFKGIEGLEDVDYDELTKSISKEDLKKVLETAEIDYNEQDLRYLTGSVPAIAPTVANQVGSDVSQNMGNFNLNIFSKLISEKLIHIFQILLFVCTVAIIVLYFDKYSFAVVIASTTALICIVLKVITIIIEKLTGTVEKEFKSMVEVFTLPLKESINDDFITFLIITIGFAALYIVMNFVVTKDSIGDSIKFLHLVNDFEDDEDDSDNKEKDEFADIDLSSIQITDIDSEIEEFSKLDYSSMDVSDLDDFF